MKRKRLRRSYLKRFHSAVVNIGSQRTNFPAMRENWGHVAKVPNNEVANGEPYKKEPIVSWEDPRPLTGPLELFKEFLPMPTASITTQPKLHEYNRIRLSPKEDVWKIITLYFCGQWAFLIEDVPGNKEYRLSIPYSVARAKLAYSRNRIQWIRRVPYAPPPSLD